MSVGSVGSRLEQLSAAVSATARQEGLLALVAELVTAEDVPSLQHLTDLMLAEGGQFSLFSRQVLSAVARGLSGMRAQAVLSEFILGRLAGREESFEEQICVIRQDLATHLQHQADFIGAARCLSQLPMEARSWTDSKRAAVYVRIAELYLEEDDAVEADTYCNRASMVITTDTDDVVLVIRYHVTHARILDSKRKFLEAANKYYSLCQNEKGLDIATDDLLQLLANAATCAILAPAGPPRSRLLASMMKDERTSSVRDYAVLKKVFLERIIHKEEMQEFEGRLPPHQKAITADGLTIIQHAMLQHNMHAVSRVHKNFRLDRLADLLQTTPAQAEKIAAKMIDEGRLLGHIDQGTRFLHFDGSEHQCLSKWDLQIADTLQLVNKIADSFESLAHPSPRTDKWRVADARYNMCGIAGLGGGN